MASSSLIGALRVTLGIDTSEFTAGTSKAAAQLRGFQRDFARTGKQFQNFGKSMTQWVTVPILGMGAAMLKMAGDFESAMIQVKINTKATGAEMAQMSDLAQDIGSKTIFSAREAADGMTMLAKAGVDTKDIIGGAAKAVTDLAAAAGSDLEPASAAISDSMKQFNLTTAELPGIVNTITGAVNESKLSFEDFTLAMGQAGGVVGSSGVEFKDFATALAGTSSMFNSGSDAGTSFKTFMMQLTPNTKKAAKAMEQYGLSFYDATGKMKSMRDIAQMLQDKFAQMSTEDRNAAFHTMFGTDAIRTAIGLMKMGGDGFDQMMAKIDGTDASQQAADRMKGFNAQLEILKGNFENLAIAVGKSGMLEAVGDLVKWLAQLIDKLSETNPELLKWATIAGTVAAAIGPLAFVFGGFVRAIGIALPLLAKLGPVFQVLGTALTYLGPVLLGVSRALLGLLANPVILGAAVVIGGIYLAWKNWDKIGPIVQRLYVQVKTWIMDKLGAVWNWLHDKLVAVGGWFFDLYDKVVGHSYVPDMVDGIRDHMARLDAEMVNPAKSATSATAQAFQQMAQQVSGLLARLFPEQAEYNQFAAELELLEKNAKKLGLSADETAEAIRRLKAEYADKAAPDTPILGGQSADELGRVVMDETGAAVEDQVDILNKKIPELGKTTKATTAEMIEAFTQMADSVMGSMQDLVHSIKNGDIMGALQSLVDIVGQVLRTLSQVGILGPGWGGGNSGGGSAPSSPGYSTGGTFTVGGSGGTDSKLVQFRASPGEQVNVRRPDQLRRGDGGELHVYVTPGEYFDARVERVARPMAEDAVNRGAAGGAIIANRQMFRRQKATLA